MRHGHIQRSGYVEALHERFYYVETIPVDDDVAASGAAVASSGSDPTLADVKKACGKLQRTADLLRREAKALGVARRATENISRARADSGAESSGGCSDSEGKDSSPALADLATAAAADRPLLNDGSPATDVNGERTTEVRTGDGPRSDGATVQGPFAPSVSKDGALDTSPYPTLKSPAVGTPPRVVAARQATPSRAAGPSPSPRTAAPPPMARGVLGTPAGDGSDRPAQGASDGPPPAFDPDAPAPAIGRGVTAAFIGRGEGSGGPAGTDAVGPGEGGQGDGGGALGAGGGAGSALEPAIVTLRALPPIRQPSR
jgi:hypothetical protein